MFLASLDAPMDGFETKRKNFFTLLGKPRLDLKGGLLDNAKAKKNPACLVIRRDFRLEPGRSKTMTFLVGYAKAETVQALIDKYGARDDPVAESSSRWAKALSRISLPEGWMAREMRWNDYYVRALSTYDDYFRSHIISQGYAYQYVLGMNIAARDPLQHMLPIVYTHPGLAKEVLRYTLSEMDESGFIPYGIKGIGVRTAGANPFPSDTNLYLMLSLSEYVLATRDFAFLEEDLPYWPLEKGKHGTVLEHMERAWRHQVRDVGIGEHGLIKLRNSDWNDSFLGAIKARDPDFDLATVEESGESVLNTAMASYIMPLFAQLLDAAGEDEFADEVMSRARSFREALLKQWNGRWFNRAVLGKGRLHGTDRLYLSLQPWAILGADLDPGLKKTLTENLWRKLSARSPIGAVNLWPAMEKSFERPGMDTNGGVWYSLNMPLIWAYAKTNPSYAYQELAKNSFHHHARSYPETWIGAWSGPDSYNSFATKRPGETWDVFPYLGFMSDFPIMCGHSHASTLFALFKLAGFQPFGQGFIIAPKLPKDEFRIETAVLSVHRQAGSISGRVVPLGDGPIVFKVRFKANQVRCDGKAIGFESKGEYTVFTVSGKASIPAEWELSK